MSRIQGLELLGVDTSKIRGKKAFCPKCSHERKNKRDRSLYLNVDSGHVKCHHCGWEARADSNEWIVKQEEGKIKQMQSPVKKQTPPKRLKPFQTGPVSKAGFDYLAKRGISEDTVRQSKIAEHKGVLCFNYYDDGKIVAAKYRKIKEKFFWQHAGCPHMLYNVDSIKIGEYAIICEGEIDALSFHEVGLTKVVSVNQGAPNPNDENADGKLQCLDTCGKYLIKKQKIYLAVDKDGPGKRLQEELIRRFGRSKCFIVEYPEGCKDANDVLVKFGKARLKQCFETAKTLPIIGVITLAEVKAQMLQEFKNGVKSGQTTHFETLDPHFKWMPGEYTVWSGLANTGKSEFLKNLLVLKTLYDGWKWAIFTPEHYPARDFYFEIIETMVGKSCDPRSSNKMSLEEFEMASDVVDKFFFFIYPEVNDNTSEEEARHTPEVIASKVKELCLTKGINGFLIDPWNQLLHMGASKREDLYLAVELSKIDRLCKEFELCGNIVAHPKGIYPDKDGVIRQPTGYDISGGPMWMNKAYNVGIIHREKINGYYADATTVSIEKVKKQKRVGKPGEILLQYEKPTGWYYEFVTGDSSIPLKGKFHHEFMGGPIPEKKEVLNLSDNEMMKVARNSMDDDTIPF